jgi:signal transduction histidine kinase
LTAARYRLRLCFPFVQAKTAKQHQRSGPGLAIVKALVEPHGGALTLESELGKGAAVTAVLPASRVAPRIRRA